MKQWKVEGKPVGVCLNVGCGDDYREGFINIDGIQELGRVDRIIDFRNDSLCQYFAPQSVDFILANDFIEHHFHWEAVSILRDFFTVLREGGRLEIRVPDFGYVVRSLRYTAKRKIDLLFGGQDNRQGKESDAFRSKWPEFYCHKYAYTQRSMTRELEQIGFCDIRTKRRGTNFVGTAIKAVGVRQQEK